MQKILLYYKFTPVKDPEMLKFWQKTLCDSLNLHGRILVSAQGINGTVGGDLEDLKTYVKKTKEFPGFKDILWKWSDGGRKNFPRMSVKVKKELVAFETWDEVKVDEKGVVGTGQHLKPEQVNEMVEKYGDDVVFFDGRNQYEAKVGRFKNAVVPDTRTSRDFKRELESGKYDELKSKKVISYCTGGVRCELLSAMMKQRGFKDVYQIDGGIVKYGEAYGDDGLWEGQLYVFDGRMGMNFSDHSKVIGECIHCGRATSNYENCANQACNELVLICDPCAADPDKLYHAAKCLNGAPEKSTQATATNHE
ncbi:rhodanese-related sulfurtransferase [Candidatus Saccharibacteria bacterium]|nr:MAG: rhodanese-related sulfurtransferase [Candidatus Saccharibacteria bacterium]